MLAYYTPAPKKPMVRNELIQKFFDTHQYEIVTWPAYYPDELCMKLLRNHSDPNVILFIAMMKGITPIVTIGDHKSFIADFNTIKEKSKRHLPQFQNPSYSNIEKVEKHLRDQRDSV